ncbi:hypothetical protein [Caldisalinibacter kiritimatiensis]|uniref:Putative membrane protein n=1 Tax=Caldisalinibacter kiritimatiensis TaxID=1304284 RepID=R1AYX2_9FIRM|nr:hypothetical protein [Caldisalinibacter kiritimatiensis]EOD01902.1 putative membrane protein [Caldisalinibacter kiritimatiensis]
MLTFKVIDDIEVIFENEEGDFDEIKIGDEIIVIVDNRNRAREIYVHREREENSNQDEISGVITDIDLVGIFHIEIDDNEYSLDEDAEVTIDGDEADLNDLEVGMEVEVELEDDVVVEIEAERIEVREVKGIIKAIDLVGNYHIKIGDKRYDLDEEADVTIDGDEADLNDLEVGMEAEIELEDDVVIKIEAENVEMTFEGKIIDIDDNELTIKKDDDIQITYEVSDDVEIEIEGIRNEDIDDLNIGDYGEFKVLNDLIIEIDIDNKVEEVEGTIIAIYENTEGIVLTIEVYDDNEYQYLLSDEVKIYMDDEDDEDEENWDVNDLAVNQEGEFVIVNNVITKIYIED